MKKLLVLYCSSSAIPGVAHDAGLGKADVEITQKVVINLSIDFDLAAWIVGLNHAYEHRAYPPGWPALIAKGAAGALDAARRRLGG